MVLKCESKLYWPTCKLENISCSSSSEKNCSLLLFLFIFSLNVFIFLISSFLKTRFKIKASHKNCIDLIWVLRSFSRLKLKWFLYNNNYLIFFFWGGGGGTKQLLVIMIPKALYFSGFSIRLAFVSLKLLSFWAMWRSSDKRGRSISQYPKGHVKEVKILTSLSPCEYVLALRKKKG